MKTINKILILVTLSLFVVSCSTVKVTDSWKANKSVDLKANEIMVVSLTNNETSRQRFEKDLTANLNENGFQSFESYIKFPEMNPTKKVEENDIINLKMKLQSNGINLVVINAIKEVEEYAETNTTNTGYGMSYYGHRYNRGFHGYYGGIQMGNSTSVTSIKKKYKLETVIYDLSQPRDKELIAVISTEIDDPQKLTKISKDFSNKIVKELVILFS